MFPLSRLTLTSRENVLKFLDPFDLFALSLCSKKSYRTVQNAVRSTSSFYSLDLHLTTNYTIGIQFETDTHWFYFSCEVLPLTIPSSPFEYTSEKLRSYWEDCVEGIKYWIEYITELYGKSIEILYLRETDPKNAVEILKFVNRRQGSIKYGHVNLNDVKSEKDRKQVMEQLESVEDLETNWEA
ncbi:unnamed protein product [Caenorhabditis brenneri]